MMKIKSFTIILCFCLIFTSSGYAIKVGTLFFYPPLVTTVEGFDVALIRQICTGMQEQCDLIQMDYKDFYPALNAGKIDIAIGGIDIANEPDYIFSTPYLLNKCQFLVLNNNTYNSTDNLSGTTVGTIKGNPTGGVAYHYLLDHYQGQIKVKEYNDMEDLITGLNTNEISAAFMLNSTVNYWVVNGAKRFKPLGDVVIIGQGIGILSLPKNQALMERINQQLQKIEKSNNYINLYNTYFGTN